MTSRIQLKPALIPQYCYIDDGRNGTDHPRFEQLLHQASILSAGENRANLIPSRLTAPFRSAATALMVGSTIAISALPANAQEAPVQRVAASTIDGGSLNSDQRQLETWELARDYSLENVELVILVYGGNSKYTPDELAQGFKREFAREGNDVTDVAIFTANPEQRGPRVAFFIDGTGTSHDIMTLREVMPHIPVAAEMFKEHAPIMREKLASQVRPVTTVALRDAALN